MKLTEIKTTYIKGLPTQVINKVIVAEVTRDNIFETVSALHASHHLPLLTIKATDQRKEGNGFVLYYVFGIPHAAYTLALALQVKNNRFPSLVPVLFEAALYEQEIKTFFGLTPEGNPFTNQLILHENWPDDVYPLRKDFPWNKRVPISNGQPYVFQHISGEGIYQIPVGPVHAGIIEPGHFRFSVIGEKILSLQAQLGYVHK